MQLLSAWGQLLADVHALNVNIKVITHWQWVCSGELWQVVWQAPQLLARIWGNVSGEEEDHVQRTCLETGPWLWQGASARPI